jgi:phosphoserine aminotransferase
MAKTPIYNFSPGPAMLPQEVMQQVQAEFLDYQGTGMSVAEVSHRGPIFAEIVEQLHANLRQILAVPDDFEILFSAGGGQGQFAALPMNLLGDYKTAAYLITGHWSRKAFDEAKRYTNPVCVADAKNNGYNAISAVSEWEMPDSAAYLYCCDNETVHGLMIQDGFDIELPVVCDMTSSLITRPVDWDRFAGVVAGCQKNIAPAGMAVIVMRKDLIARSAIKETPNIMNYQTLVKSNSLANTPATFSWYVANLVCQWVMKEGGVEEMERRCNERSQLLYDCIDGSDFYSNQVDKAYRSTINVCFNLQDDSLLDAFLAGAKEQGLLSLKGHRAVGGLRANLYNAMPMAGVEKLVAYMQAFSASI